MGLEYSSKDTEEEKAESARSSRRGNGGESLSPIMQSPHEDQRSERPYHYFRRQIAEKIRSFASKQLVQATEDLNNVADAFRQTGESLQARNQITFAGHINSLADGVERFSGGLRQSNLDSVLNKAKSLARENPVAFMGGAFVLGVLFAHMLKGAEMEENSSDTQSHDFYDFQNEVSSYGKH